MTKPITAVPVLMLLEEQRLLRADCPGQAGGACHPSLYIPQRKGGHSTTYPLSPIVGTAILEYVQHGRPTTPDRHLFFRVVAPLTPATVKIV